MEETARAQTQIQLQLRVGLGQGEVMEPGRNMACNLTLTTNRPLEIYTYRVKFRSVGVCRRSSGRTWPWRQERGPEVVREEEYACTSKILSLIPPPSPPQPDHPHQPDHRHQPQEYPFDHAETEFAERRTDQVGRAVTRRRTYNWVPMLRIPRHAADTWTFSNRRLSQYTATITNLVQAEVTYRRLDGVDDEELGWLDTDGQPDELRTVRVEQEVMVRNRNAPVERFGYHCAVESPTLSDSWFRGSRGGITCLLTARDQLVVRGQDIPLLVQIDNSTSRTLHTVSLQFVQEVTLTDPSRENVTVGVDRDTIMAVTLPPVAPHSDWQREITHFTAPPNTMYSGSIRPCTFATLRFLVLLKVQWMLGSLQCCVEVKVGNRFSLGRRLECTHMQKYDVA